MPCSLAQDGGRDNVPIMCDLLLLAVHLLVTLAKLLHPGGARAVAAESLLLKHQLLISNRCRQRAPNLTTLDRFATSLRVGFEAWIAQLAARACARCQFVQASIE